MPDPSDDPPSSSPKPVDSSSPQPLNYLSPREDPQHVKLESSRARAGAILAAASVVLLTFSWVAATIRIVPPRAPAPAPSLLGPIIATVITLALLGGITLFQYKRYASIAFGQGVLIGAAIGFLLDGVCYVLALN